MLSCYDSTSYSIKLKAIVAFILFGDIVERRSTEFIESHSNICLSKEQESVAGVSEVSK